MSKNKKNNIIDFEKEKEKLLTEHTQMDEMVPNWELIDMDYEDYDPDALIELTIEEAEAFIALGLLDPDDLIYDNQFMDDDEMFISFEAILDEEDIANEEQGTEKHTMDLCEEYRFIVDGSRDDSNE